MILKWKKIVYAEEAAEKAYAEGKLEGNKEIALKMLEDGIPIEKVASYCTISVEQIKAFQTESQKIS